MAYALINPDIISWAIQRSGLSVSDLSKKLKIDEEKLNQIEQGIAPIAFGKAKEFAKITNIPFGFLFLDRAPEEVKLELPDLRTIESQEIQQPSYELKEIIRLNQERVEWYRDYLNEHGLEPNSFVGSLGNASVHEMVLFLNKKLNVKRDKDSKNYYRNLVQAIENLRIMVVQDSNLGHHTKSLNVEEFRGFAIADKMAPLIFVNTADSSNAQLFTLIHELAHILKGESGVSDNSVSAVNPIEKYCNAVTGEFLVPKLEFQKQWQASKDSEFEIVFQLLSKHFHVSRHVVARRALTLDYISKNKYDDYIHYMREEYISNKKKNTGKGGPDYYIVKNSKLSSQLSQAVISESFSGKMLYRDAGYILGIKPSKLEVFAKKVGIQL
jgi:Zn-dependent peptidase ImmA (M78 family)